MQRTKLGAAPAVALCGLLLMAGCDRQPGQPRPEATTAAPTAEPAQDKTPERAAEASPASSTQTCHLSVDGQVRVQGPCLVFPFGDGGYTMNAWSNGKPSQSHFAVVTTNGDGTADATWNADPDDARAGDPLGKVTFADGCWSNDRARICAGMR
ncbi:hypothetical protein [Brevundimonas sp.]|uniref:hypothetical protein n=1 Tax=Brevundimonas sp. TaxID=1871086 RepID=UPI00289DEB75|nr:hypothetical protein [Brevundimonas sp.]